MNRRVALRGLAALCATAWSFRAHAQQTKKVWRIGAVYTSSAPVQKPLEDAFLGAMRDLGYAIGHNLILDSRHAGADPKRYPAFVDEVLSLKPDLLIGANTQIALVMKSRTSTIPIVLATSLDPVGDGLAQSLARPGGNITGVALQAHDLGGKHIELMSELLPRMRRAGLLLDVQGVQRHNEAYERTATAAASGKGISIETYRVGSEDNLTELFRSIQAKGAAAVLMHLSPRLNANRRQIIEHSAKLRLPSVAFQEFFAEDGGLMSYGPTFVDSFRRVAYFADRIFKGTKPADLPLEQPTRFALTINAKTAKLLGLTIPQSLLVRADRVIE
jgi:putative ABC transport system substrate-binding protein